MNFFLRKKPATEFSETPVITESAATANDEVAAVIALALHMYVKQMREYENAVVTIQKVIKPYSPWSSKIYGLRQQPIRIPNLKARIR